MRTLVLVLIGLVAGITIAVYMNRTTIGATFGPSCTIGVTGTAAMVEVKGWTASSVCDTMANKQGMYRYNGDMIPPPICQYEFQDDRFTVHDEGVLKLVGNAMCVALGKASGQDTSSGQFPDLAVATATPETYDSPNCSVDLSTPTATPFPVVADTPTPTPYNPQAGAIAAVQAYHAAAEAAYGPQHDDSQVDQTMTGVVRDAILCVMRDRSDSLMNTRAYFTYQDLADQFGPVSIQGDSATVVEHKHQILTLHKADGSTSDQDNTFTVTYTVTRSGNGWLVAD